MTFGTFDSQSRQWPRPGELMPEFLIARALGWPCESLAREPGQEELHGPFLREPAGVACKRRRVRRVELRSKSRIYRQPVPLIPRRETQSVRRDRPQTQTLLQALSGSRCQARWLQAL